MSGFISSIPSNTKELGINPEQVLWIKEIFNMLRGSQSPRKIPFVEYFAKKYPGLASITVENGIDDSERRILSTEGAAFMKELEQLIQSGDRL
jgi:hypothetical protein